MITICEDIILIRVDVAQGIQGRVDVYMNICVCECAFVFNTGCSTVRRIRTHTQTHRGRVVVEVFKSGVNNMERKRK